MVDNVTTASDKILSTAKDDYGTTYYFRGNPIDNYVEFAGMCFRTVRIQGDGSVKLILASELSCSEENLTNDSGYVTDGVRGIKGTILTGHYGYKTQNGFIISDYINSSSYNSLSARIQLNDWLDRKITSEEQELLKDEKWCIGDLTNAYSYDNTGAIVGVVDELIASGTNFKYTAANKYWVTKTPSYKCETTEKDGEVDINKVGLLTFDEIVYSGGGNVSNSTYYLNNNATTNAWWSLSPSDFKNGRAEGGAFLVYSNGLLRRTLADGDDDYTLGYRVSLTLKYNVKNSDGDGTLSNPYVIE